MALNDKSLAHLEQYSALELLFKNNPAPVGSNSAFAARRILYAGTLTNKCYVYRDTANNSTKGFTKAKNANKKACSISASAITGKAKSYAIHVNNTELEGQMAALTQNAIYRTNDPDFAGVIQSIDNILTPFIASDPTGTLPYFTALQITAMQTDSAKFVSSLDQYKNAVGVINTAKGNFVAIAIPEMETHITFFEGFLTDMSVTYPDFVTSFKAIVDKLNIIGKRNQGVSASMQYAATGVPINSIGELRITNYPAIKHPKIIHTNTMGEIKLLQLKIGVWNGIFSCPGCVDQPVTITVKAKKVTHFDIKMVANP